MINATAWIEGFRPGSGLLGYYTRFDRSVTHYKGRCYGYMPKDQLKTAKYTITD